MKKWLIFIIMFLIFKVALASGTAAGMKIVAPSSNLVILYTDSEALIVTKSSSEFGIADDEHTILEINGLVQTNINDSEISSFYDNGVYRGILGGTGGTVRQYVLSFQYLNRGNTSEDVKITANVEGGENRWWVEEDITKNILEDEIKTYFITLNVQNPVALEDVTLTTLAKLITANNVVSYNAFTGAVGVYDGGFLADVVYGGTNNITNQFYFEAEGAALEYLSKTTEVIAPSGYGTPSNAKVPGSKIRITTQLKNNSTAVAAGVKLRDKIPNNCHFYPVDTPAVSGAANEDYVWIGGSSNTLGAGGVIGWDDIIISPNATISVEYTVTID